MLVDPLGALVAKGGCKVEGRFEVRAVRLVEVSVVFGPLENLLNGTEEVGVLIGRKWQNSIFNGG